MSDAIDTADGSQHNSRIHPDDEHNRRLLAAVHPAGWSNPEPSGRYDLVVIGAGTAGLVSAAGAAGLGAKVALIERHLMGGDCLNVGCVPSKGLIRAARAWHAVGNAGEFGIEAKIDGDFSVAIQRMRKIRADISVNDGVQRFSELGIDVYLGQGAFLSPNSIAVGNARLQFRRAVIATGARATGIPIPGLEETGYVTNETLFELESLPPRLAVIGAGPIGCEMAQAFARFGSRVTMLDQAPRVLPREDPDASTVIEAALAKDGVQFVGSAEIENIGRRDSVRTIEYVVEGKRHRVDADEILLSVGRRPNVEKLGLEEAGIDFDGAGITVNAKLRTSNRRVYACGDVSSRFKFTHTADAEARIVIQNALFFGRARADRLIVPWCTYTSPEVAHVGLTIEDARDKGIEIDSVTIQMAEVDRAKLDGSTEGFLKVHLKKGSDKILGATIVAEHAGDIVGELALAIRAGIGLETIASTIHPYPTQAEVIKKAADAWRRTKLTPKIKKLFAAYFRMFRST
jgi:pyruvate/2-oxoglutarate dehydrogenase complex dihydrolipoamide dehydrogenase (E3) component